MGSWYWSGAGFLSLGVWHGEWVGGRWVVIVIEERFCRSKCGVGVAGSVASF